MEQMMGRKDPFEVKTVKAWSGGTGRKIRKLVKKGWEVVSSQAVGMSGWHTVTLRRPNPKYRGSES